MLLLSKYEALTIFFASGVSFENKTGVSYSEISEFSCPYAKNSGGIIGPRKSRSQLFSVFLFVGIYQTKQNTKQPASWTHTNLKHQHILLFNRWVLSEDQIQVLLTELSGLPQVLIENFLPFTPQQLKVLLVFLVINTVETGKMIGNSITWHNSMESDHSLHFDLAL